MNTYRRFLPSLAFRRPAMLTRLAVFLMIAGLVAPLLPATPAAARQTGLPPEVLASSVRVMTNIEVVPDDNDEDPFVCEIEDGVLADYSVGSGTLISADGFILTNRHVVDAGRMPREIRNFCEDQAPGGKGEAEFIQIAWLPDAKGQPADPYRVELIDESTASEDLAVLKITEHLDGSEVEEDFPFVTFGDSDLLREPEKIITIGYPANAGNSRIVSEGIFSGWADNGYGVPWIYTDATISGGNSGGTAVNSDGYFIGIPTQATFSDCRPGDTNNDGIIDEEDQGCIGLGGNFGMLIPSNLARAFAEEATGETFAVGTPSAGSETPTEEATEEAEEEPTEEVAQDGPAIGEIVLNPLGVDDEPLDTPQNVHTIEACFDNNTLEDGDVLEIEWFQDGASVLAYEEEWDETWGDAACASLFIDEEEANPYFDPGSYSITIVIDGETFESDEMVIVAASFVGAVEISGRTVDGDTVEADADGVLTGEIERITADVTFTGMEEDAIWQAELLFDDESIWESDADAWTGEADGSESLRILHPEEDVFPAGTYELVISVDGVETSRTTIVIED